MPTTKILLGVTGSIAAYKSAELVRLFKQLTADVCVVMTPAARTFVSPTTLQTLSQNPVRHELFNLEEESSMSHINLARWADCVLIAPASAHMMAKLACGLADDLLSTLCLATQAPVVLAPAMNTVMWHASATQANYDQLNKRGIYIIHPEFGEQACGEHGYGRMAEPQTIVETIHRLTLRIDHSQQPLYNKHVIITAGPTQEPLDPVRYISNKSSGKMGYALAQAALEQGAHVTLISGPCKLTPPPQAHLITVITAQQMLDACLKHIDHCDILIGAAAVCDFRPQLYLRHKIKKHPSQSQLSTSWMPTPDILHTITQQTRHLFTVGFAAETEHLIKNAQQKLDHKGLDMIVANPIDDQHQPFGDDNNTLFILWHGGQKHLPTQPKIQLAQQLLELIIDHYQHKHTSHTS